MVLHDKPVQHEFFIRSPSTGFTDDLFDFLVHSNDTLAFSSSPFNEIICGEPIPHSLSEPVHNNSTLLSQLSPLMKEPNQYPATFLQRDLSYNFEWTHKKGKVKPHQFWVYCEEKQQSYARLNLQTKGFNWTSSSKMFLHENLFVFVENYRASQSISRAIRFVYDSDSFSYIPYEGEVPTSELVPIDRSKLQLQFELVEDMSHPQHPFQGAPHEVKMKHEPALCLENNEPFQCAVKFSFSNRVEGWFKLACNLLYNGVEVFRSESGIFMFNNPRMKKRKEFLNYTSPQIKFMQVYSLSLTTSEDYWLQLGVELGYSVDRVLQMLSLANAVFVSRKRKLSTVTANQPPAKRIALEVPQNLSFLENDDFSFPASPVNQHSLASNSANCTIMPLRTYLYQWMSPYAQKLENHAFCTIHLPSNYSYELFLDSIQQKEKRRVQRVFALCSANKVTEICNASDFERVLNGSSTMLAKTIILSDSLQTPTQMLFNHTLLAPQNLLFPPPPSLNLALPSFVNNVQEDPEREYSFTIRDVNMHEVREVYTTKRSLAALTKAVADEFGVPVNSVSKLCKTSTGALLNNDKNVVHLKDTDIVIVHLTKDCTPMCE